MIYMLGLATGIVIGGVGLIVFAAWIKRRLKARNQEMNQRLDDLLGKMRGINNSLSVNESALGGTNLSSPARVLPMDEPWVGKKKQEAR